ncbi:hypothetical protein [Paraburkholderia sp. MM5384-R2]|uniref:hypothetical protein n=1 Tax=Paraburkholderia sp. MM5384-R2 TaxID=2723097 RepID=UPI001615CA5A|nr:hypothetical protein [Paraburkholderia sp. MM5384-R2]MBB5501290.1 hypothetical protein [Paraburkholderia sp. MM5384-R2]
MIKKIRQRTPVRASVRTAAFTVRMIYVSSIRLIGFGFMSVTVPGPVRCVRQRSI